MLARTTRISSSLICASGSRLLSSSSARRAITNFQMPAMSPTMTEGGIASWKKKEGESFVAGDVLLEIETDKATIDVEAQDDGILGKIIAPDGTKNVPVGKIIALLAEEGDDISNLQPPKEETPSQPAKQETAPPPPSPSEPSASASSPAPHSQSSASSSHSHSGSGALFPSVHRLLLENNISDSDLHKITGTGVRGMVTKGDVLAFLGKASGPLGTFKPTLTPIEEALKHLQKKGGDAKATATVTPLDGTSLRKLIVSTMLQNSIKARAIPATAEAPDFDSIIADYLPPSSTNSSIPKEASAILESVSRSKAASAKKESFLDGLI